MRSWDSRTQRFSFTYDTARRPVSLNGASEKLLGRVVYGDLLGTPTTTNHAGRVYRVYDGAPKLQPAATTTAFDFKGQPTSETRQLVANKTAEPDWSVLLGESTISEMTTAVATASLLDTTETFSASSERDALGRVLVAVSPDGSEVAYGYDEGGGLQTVELKHRGSSTAQTVVGEIEYDARGQRTRVVYGSTSSPTSTTRYTYDPQTFRLSRLWTERGSDSAGLQSLFYHYDPVGNVTDIRDTAQQTVYFNNSVVAAANSYVYDAVYRLVEATGREHSADGTAQRTHTQLPVGPQPMTSDPSAMRLYRQEYTYDAVGNLLTMKHIPTGGTGWTRWYEYDDDGNRLLANSAAGDSQGGPYSHTYSYDAHGSMTSMPHLSSMVWGHDDALRQVTVGTETVSFQYAGGIRSRKYVEKSGAVTEERIYLGPWEVYRKRVSGALDVERESLHVSDGSGRMLLVETKTVDGGTPVGTPVGMWRYQLGNHLGSAAGEIDETGAVISYEEYHPYGTSAYRAVDSSVEVSARRYRYTGMERDEETGLGYHSARYYAPWLGRWTAADPIGLGDGVNRFRYSGCSPVVAADLNGKNPFVFDGEEPQQWVQTEEYTGLAPGADVESATRAQESRNAEQRQNRDAARQAKEAERARAEAAAQEPAGVAENKEFLARKTQQNGRSMVRAEIERREMSPKAQAAIGGVVAGVELAGAVALIEVMPVASVALFALAMDTAEGASQTWKQGRAVDPPLRSAMQGGLSHVLPEASAAATILALDVMLGLDPGDLAKAGKLFIHSGDDAVKSGARMGHGGGGGGARAFSNKFPEHPVGAPLQTFLPEQLATKTGRINYVVLEDGTLLLGRRSNELGGGHIDLAGGRPVLAAGEVKVVKGEIRYVDNSSGHYEPSGAAAQSAAEAAFQKAGIDISGKYIEKAWDGQRWVAK